MPKWPGTLPIISSSQQAIREFKQLKSGWSNESVLGTRTLIYAVQLLEVIAGKKRTSRKPSAYNKFFAAGARAGKSAKQIAKEWKEHRPR